MLIREKVVFRGPKQGDAASKAVSLQSTGEFILLHVDLLRRYLDLEFRTMVRMHACAAHAAPHTHVPLHALAQCAAARAATHHLHACLCRCPAPSLANPNPIGSAHS